MSEHEDGQQVVNFEREHAKRLPELQARLRRSARQKALAELWRIREATGLYPPHMTGSGPEGDEVA